MDKKSIQKRHDITHLDTDTLLAIAEKSKWAVLAEKFLNLAFEKNKNILLTLEEQKAQAQKNERIKKATYIGFVLACLGAFILPEPLILEYIVAHEYPSRIVVGVALGLTLCSALMLFFDLKIAVWVIPFTLYMIYYHMPQLWFLHILGTPKKRFAFLLFTMGAGAIPIAKIAAKGILGGFALLSSVFRPQKAPYKKEGPIQTVLQQAIDASSQAKKQEIEELIEAYHPEYAAILSGLKDKKPHKQTQAELLEKPFPNPQRPAASQEKNHILPFYLGVNAQGEHLTLDLASLPHMVVGGTTGSGKSNFLQHLVASFLEKEDTKILIIDPEGVDFVAFKKQVELIDPKNAYSTISLLIVEMNPRKEAFLELGISKLEEWRGYQKKPPRIVLIIDEYADLIGIKDLQDRLSQVARKGRKWGIHIVLATQRPSAKVINEQIKSNLPCLLAFRCANADDAKVLKAKQAHTIPIEKTGLAYLVQSTNPVLYQTPLAPKTNTPPVSQAPKTTYQPHTPAFG